MIFKNICRCFVIFVFSVLELLHIFNTSKRVVQIFAMIISRDLSDWIIAKPPNFLRLRISSFWCYSPYSAPATAINIKKKLKQYLLETYTFIINILGFYSSKVRGPSRGGGL